MSRRVVAQLSGIVLGRLVASVAQAVTIVLLARALSPSVFGLVIAAQAVLTALAVVLGLGFAPYIGVLRAREPGSPIVDEVFKLNRIMSWVLTCVCVAVLVVLGFIDPVFWVLTPLGVALGFQRDAAVWNSIAVADGQVGLFSRSIAIRRVATLCIFALLLFSATIQAVLAYCSAVLISEWFYNVRLKRRAAFVPGRVKHIQMRLILRGSKFFWLDAISGQLRLLDVAVIGVVLGPLAAGYVAVPSKVASPLMLLPSSFATLILPRVSSGCGRTVRQGVYLAMGVTSMIGVVLLVLSMYLPDLIGILLGPSYIPSVPIARIYFVGFVFLSLVYTVGAVLQGAGFQSAVGKNSAIASVVSISVLALAGYFWGLEAAIWAYVAALAAQVGGLAFIYIFVFRGVGRHIDSLRSDIYRTLRT
ncbi:oligosaccharide flippase family protein [Kocuria sp. UCD-OTCP]|uniref:oligosaccharide flippase family protein n=1 Tax=Kocuria sp. UCD-OTCP TaxID=1292021 RepID=UPI0009DB0BCB|nr:oligosaccharide flippase family protein [Kocuria sp. UCD-OTCP]